MSVLLALLMLLLLLRSATVMAAASDACRLFVTAVLPCLFPYMVLSLLLVSRVKRPSPTLLMLLGWGGGSPMGARLLTGCDGLSRRTQVRLALSCATMSPMFLLGTVGGWLHSFSAGITALGSVLLGGWLTGLLAGRFTPDAPAALASAVEHPPRSFGEAVDQAARTMLFVCGTMAMLRVLSALAEEALPAAWSLPVLTLLEVTTGTAKIAALPLPLPLRTALIAGAAGFGGLAILLQNRSFYPAGMLSPVHQLLWQGLHGAFSFVIALGMMLLVC